MMYVGSARPESEYGEVCTFFYVRTFAVVVGEPNLIINNTNNKQKKV